MTILFLSLPTLAVDTAKVTEISQTRDRGFDYLDIYTCGGTKATGLLLEDQLQIKFKGAILDPDLKITRHRSQRIKAIRVAQTSTEATIIIEFLKPIDYDVVNVYGCGKSVIEISDRLDQAEHIMAAWEKTNLETSRQVIKPYKYLPVKSSDRSLAGKIIVLAPGHGGRDPGAISKNGIPEKTLTLSLAHKTAQMLKQMGATVYLTRSGDEMNNLCDVVNFANSSKCDIFISMHYNFINRSDISGTETYYYNPESRPLALHLHQALLGGINRKDRGLRRAMYYAVHHTTMPAVLLEPIYISNDEESNLAGSVDFQNELAESIVRGVKTYFRNKFD